MTQIEFELASFSKGDKAIYIGKEYPILGVDFDNMLLEIELDEVVKGSTVKRIWVKFYHIKYIPKPF